ncbi:MAG: PilZ domain-containing protein [Bacteriovoracaceae bacterium]|nr:PilZ domain-containing protein [Bacteriovoracaceae bacterium]
MDRQFDLIKTEYREVEKRLLPRFPFSFLMFRPVDESRVFEVSDISHTGMQIGLKDGECQIEVGRTMTGHIQWRSHRLEVEGKVVWARENRLGLSFDESLATPIKEYFSVENIVEGLRPVHDLQMGVEIPSNLKYWLRADGPMEVFIWKHSDGEFSRFQFILLDSFVEWEDGRGVKSGKVVTKRDVETPLFSEDEFVFQLDEGVDFSKINFAKDVIEKLSTNLLPEAVIHFLKVKLGG